VSATKRERGIKRERGKDKYKERETERERESAGQVFIMFVS
jgi:hypothetical protein